MTVNQNVPAKKLPVPVKQKNVLVKQDANAQVIAKPKSAAISQIVPVKKIKTILVTAKQKYIPALLAILDQQMIGMMRKKKNLMNEKPTMFQKILKIKTMKKIKSQRKIKKDKQYAD